MTTGVGSTMTMGYDGLRRLTSVTGGPVTRQYTYRDIDSTKTTMQVASVTSGGQRYGYTYDSMGNIATFSAPGKGTVTYTYDNQGQRYHLHLYLRCLGQHHCHVWYSGRTEPRYPPNI